MTLLELLPVEPWMVRDLAKNLREGDLEEVSFSGLTPFDALLKSVKLSLYAKAAVVFDHVVAMWGIAGTPIFNDTGSVWFMTSPFIERYPFALMREGRKELQKMRALYPRLEGTVSASYPQALRFVESLGFQIEEGPGPILTFSMES